MVLLSVGKCTTEDDFFETGAILHALAPVFQFLGTVVAGEHVEVARPVPAGCR